MIPNVSSKRSSAVTNASLSTSRKKDLRDGIRRQGRPLLDGARHEGHHEASLA